MSFKQQIDELIIELHSLNIVTDESSNIKHMRICNISIHTPHGSLHYISENIHAKRMDAIGAARWLKDHLHTLTNGNLKRLNSCTTDTCSTMYSMWECLQTIPKLKHCLFIPCDSHSIQLLVKDLLSLPHIREHNFVSLCQFS